MTDRPEYLLHLDGQLVVQSAWLPMAVAGWERYSRDLIAAQHGGELVLSKDGIELARVRPSSSKHGFAWPDSNTDAPDLADLAAGVQQLARAAGVGVTDLAQEMTTAGLATSRSRLERIKSRDPAKNANTSPAELVVMCHAAVTSIKRQGDRP